VSERVVKQLTYSDGVGFGMRVVTEMNYFVFDGGLDLSAERSETKLKSEKKLKFHRVAINLMFVKHCRYEEDGRVYVCWLLLPTTMLAELFAMVSIHVPEIVTKLGSGRG